MKAKAALKAGALAIALSTLPACKAPMVETLKPLSRGKPAALQVQEPKKHPCVTSVIPGGRQDSCHVLLQIHESPIDHSLDRGSAVSQVLIYHILSDLIKNYGTDTVLLEGVRPIDDLRKMLPIFGNDKSRAFVKKFKTCASNISAQIKKQRPDLSYRQAGADFCLASGMLRGYPWTMSHYMLLVFQNPSAKFTGLERRPDQLSKSMAQMRLMDKLSKNPDLMH